MKWKMLITALLIGTSSMATVAAAQPADGYDGTRDHRDRGDWDRGQRWVPPQPAPVPAQYGQYNNGDYETSPSVDGYHRHHGNDGTWQPLVSPVVVANQRQFIHVGSNLGWMRAVRLDVTSGTAYVYAIGVQYADHTVQKVMVDRWLDVRDNRTLVFDVSRPNVQVVGFVVYTPGHAQGTYALSKI